MKSALAWLRLRCFRNESKKLKIYRDPVVTQVEMQLLRAYMRADKGEHSNVN